VTFEDFNLNEKVREGLESMGYKVPTPVQAEAIPKILEGTDIIACAQTGTGKTAAYILPIVHKILTSPQNTISTLILSPTRELALQIDQALEGFAYYTGVSSFAIYGGGDGSAYDRERKALREGGADIIIATPGRLISHLNSGAVAFSNVQHLILDEADRMLDMGFYDDIIRIIKYLPEKRQNLLFSATMPPKIRTLAGKILKDPISINISITKPAAGVTQQAAILYDRQKIPFLMHLLHGKENEIPSIIIFCSTKQSVKDLDRELKKLKFSVKAFHSDLEQNEREDILSKFRSRQLQMLVATDILSRGIDIENITLVINYDVPNDGEDYVHRVGRTARAETKGTAITLVSEKDQKKFSRIELQIGKEIDRLTLPGELGEVPVYNPAAKVAGGNKKKSFKKKPRPKA
jgi:superfamily II DNA/RNA helicase